MSGAALRSVGSTNDRQPTEEDGAVIAEVECSGASTRLVCAILVLVSSPLLPNHSCPAAGHETKRSTGTVVPNLKAALLSHLLKLRRPTAGSYYPADVNHQHKTGQSIASRGFSGLL